jgi:glycosyltransferase involved in cell wall biosynthesis
MTPHVWVVNDLLTAIPGTRTLWHELLYWFGAVWAGGHPYSYLADVVEQAIQAAPRKPDVVIRNGSYFPWFTTCGRPVISLVQDILDHDDRRGWQAGVIQNSDRVVFNSAHTAAHFPEAAHKGVVIPIGTDFDLFSPDPHATKTTDVCWVGSRNEVKGYDRLWETIGSSGLSFTLVLKDGSDGVDSLGGRVRAIGPIDQVELARVINSCRIGLCTSRQETQHLAGIEMAACGLAVVAPPVGNYANRPAWARVCDDPAGYAEALCSLLDEAPDRNTIRSQAFPMSMAACEAAWKSLVMETTK